MDVYVIDYKYGPEVHYEVWVDGKKYDGFRLLTGPRLTHSQMIDVANGYREGLSW